MVLFWKVINYVFNLVYLVDICIISSLFFFGNLYGLLKVDDLILCNSLKYFFYIL